MRVDITLRAMLPYDKPMQVLPANVWQRWSQEVNSRLEHAPALLPEDVVRQDDEGDLEILGWKGEPRLLIDCHDGALLLSGIELASWQALTPPPMRRSRSRGRHRQGAN